MQRVYSRVFEFCVFGNAGRWASCHVLGLLLHWLSLVITIAIPWVCSSLVLHCCCVNSLTTVLTHFTPFWIIFIFCPLLLVHTLLGFLNFLVLWVICCAYVISVLFCVFLLSQFSLIILLWTCDSFAKWTEAAVLSHRKYQQSTSHSQIKLWFSTCGSALILSCSIIMAQPYYVCTAEMLL